jgi:hypothetical protein
LKPSAAKTTRRSGKLTFVTSPAAIRLNNCAGLTWLTVELGSDIIPVLMRRRDGATQVPSPTR